MAKFNQLDVTYYHSMYKKPGDCQDIVQTERKMFRKNVFIRTDLFSVPEYWLYGSGQSQFVSTNVCIFTGANHVC